MNVAQTKINYYFSGDKTLPFSLADNEDPVSVLAGDRTKQLLDHLDDGVTVNGTVKTGAHIEGPAFIGAGTVIHPGAEIHGPVYIGPNCSIRHGAQVRAGSILGEGCVIGHSAEIKNSVIMSGAKVQSGAFVGDSVIGLGTRIASGVIVANRRFAQDEVFMGSGREKLATGLHFFGAIVGDYCRLGANVVTAPGTLIGAYTWVAPMVSLFGFTPRAKLVLLNQELVIRDKEEGELRSGRGEYENH